jgi:hypothetical protein
MVNSDAGRKDPSMLGGTNYPRSPLDHYPTPPRATNAFVSVVEDELEAMQGWEPFCGDGAISKIVAPRCRNFVSTDIRAYEGFEPAGLFDFFALENLDPIEALVGFRPDAIISNPPYGKDADRAVRKALELMEPERGYVAFLMRHEWDAAKGRADLIDHPAFMAKVTLRFRPVWVAKKEGEASASPRFSFAWYVWDWTKAHSAPNAKAEMHYAG